jgi:pentatricopeptide repeat protein
MSSTETKPRRRQQQQQQEQQQQQHCNSTKSSPPKWLKESQTLFTKVQHLIDDGNYEAALRLANTIPFRHDVDRTTLSSYAELLDPYSMLLEQRLDQGKWDQGIADYHRLLSTPWGSAIPFNRRAVKATLLLHCALGRWDDVEKMLKRLQITMTTKTVGRMMVTLMDLKVSRHPASAAPAPAPAPTNRHAIGGDHIIRALQAFERTLGLQVNSKTLARIMGHLGDCGNMGAAYRLYRWVRGEKLCATNIRPPTLTHRCSRSIIYLAMIEAAIKNNDTATAERIWHERMHRGVFSDDPNAVHFKPATLSAYNILLNIYASQLPHPRLSRVRRTYRRLLNSGYTPDTYTYNTLMKAFVNVGEPDKAYQMFDTMVRSGNTRPDSRSINLLLRGWIEKNEWHHVEEFVQRLQQMDPMDLDGGTLDSEYTFNIMLQGFLRLDKRTMAVNRLLKSHGDWRQWKHLQPSIDQSYSLSPRTVWEIFESATGSTAKEIKSCLTFPLPSSRSSSRSSSLSSSQSSSQSTAGMISITRPLDQKPIFAGAFNQQGFNQVSCKLFIMAFTLANDPKSAELIKKWMLRCYPSLK